MAKQPEEYISTKTWKDFGLEEPPIDIPPVTRMSDIEQPKTSMLEGLWKGFTAPIEQAYNEFSLGGRELGQGYHQGIRQPLGDTGKKLSGITDILKGGIHTAILPFTAPLGAITEGLNESGSFGKEVARGINQPFENLGYLVNEGSKLVQDAFAELGIDLSNKNVSDKTGLSEEFLQKADELVKEGSTLYLLGKSAKDIKTWATKEIPKIKQLKEGEISPNVESDIKQKIEVSETKDLLSLEELKSEINTKPKVEPIEQVVETKSIEVPKVETKPIETVEAPKIEPIEGLPTKPAKDISNKLVEKGFDELSPEELANYNPITKEATIKKATDLLENDYNKAKDIATGKQTSKDISPSDEQVLFNAVKNKAIEEGNAQTLKELALSPIATRRSEAAQTLGASGFNNGEMGSLDPVKAIQEVVKIRKEVPSKRNAIVEEGYKKKITELENRVSELEKKKTDRAYKKILREESANVRKEKRQATKEVLKKDFDNVMSEFIKSYKPNLAIDPAQVKVLLKAVRIKAQEGITDAAQVIDDIYIALVDKIDGITKKDIRDAISGYGKSTIKTRDELSKQVADLKSQMETISKIEDLESGSLPNKRKTTKTEPSEELQKLRDELKSKMSESDIIAEENLGKTKENIRKRIKDINEKIEKGEFEKESKREKLADEESIKLQKELQDIRDKFNDIQKNLGDKISDEEVKIISDLSKKTIDAKTKMEESPRRELGKEPTKEELEYGRARVAYAEYIDGLKEQANKMTWEEFKQSPMMNFIKGLGHIPGMTKSLKATFDNSGLFNQNLRVLLTHPTIWTKNGLKSFQDIWNTFGGKNVMAEINADKVSRPNYELYKKEKLAVGTVEEQFPDSKLLEKVPILGTVHKAANTAFTGMAYRNRMDLFDLLVKHAESTGADYTGIGKVVNSLTGRGSLGKFEGGADILNATMFSPRLLKSHIDVLTAHAFSKDLSPFARQEAIKNLMKIVGGLAATTTAINAIKPGTIEIDPRSTDFLRVKIGDTRFNYTGGLGSIITLSSRLAPLLVGQESYTKNSKGELVELNSGKFGARTGFNVLTDFMQGKSSPLLGAVLSRLEGQTFSGDRLTMGNELTNLAMPLPIQNFIETQENPKSADLLTTTIADAIGLFATTYSDDPDLKKVKDVMLKADKEKLYGESRQSFNLSLRRALKNNVITQEQFDEYKKQFLELQKDAPRKKEKK